MTPCHFAWQAWHLATSTLVWRGRRGTWRHLSSFCLAGVALVALGWLCWRAWTGLVAGDAAAFCMAGAHLATSTFGFAWQAWHLVTIYLRFTRPALVARLDRISRRWRRGTLRGGRGAWRHLLWFCVAGVALGHIHLRFAWQAWHLWHWTGSGGALGPVLVAGDAAALCVAGVALGDIHLRFAFFHTPSFTHHLWPPTFTHHLWNPTLSHTMFDSPSFTHHVWHTIFHTPCLTHPLSHTIFHTPPCHTPSFTHHLSHTTLSHTIFHTPLCLTPSFTTPSFTHHFVTHHLSPHHISHTTLSHTIFRHTTFHTQLCHTPSFATPSFTHHFVTYHRSHTILSHVLFHTQPSHTHHLSHTTLSHTHTHTIFLCHTPSFTYSFATHNFVLLLDPPPPPLSFLPCPRYNLWCSLLEEVALWGYPVLQLWGKGCIFLSSKRWQTTQTHWWINMCVYIIHTCIQTLLMNATILLVISGKPTSSDFPGYSKTHIHIYI